MPNASSLSRHARIWNLGVLTLMVAGLAVAYAAATLLLATESLVVQIALWVLIVHGIAGSSALFYARFLEPWWIAVKRTTVPFPLAKPLRIAIVGDFHVGPYKQEWFIEHCAARMNALKPDLVFLVGDFLFDHAADVEHLRPLKDLFAPLGVFAVVGNHDSSSDHLPGTAGEFVRDRSDDLVRYLEPLGIRFLRNTSVEINARGETLRIAGTDDVWMESCNLHTTFRDIPRGTPTILLSHNPDITLDPASHRANLVVSGHTHGGQVRLPFIGSLAKIPQRLSQEFDRGTFTVTPRCTLAVTHGIGETFVPLRFFARPEILLLETVPTA